MAQRRLRVGIVAGEASGDILGASVLAALTQRGISVDARGVGGPRMQAEGFNSLYDMERLSVMGLIDPLLRLPELLRMRSTLRREMIASEVDVFLGIDAPDFNLGLELGLRGAGVRVAHLVSPSVWAWRRGRIHKIARAVDRMLALFPFETKVYEDHQIPVTFVGHPLADQIPMQSDRIAARESLGLPHEAKIIGLLPGSRSGEIKMLGDLFIQTAVTVSRSRSDIRFLLPAANSNIRSELERLAEGFPGLPLRIIDGGSQTAMAAADCLLMASGTATLEAMLLKRPMVVAYRMGFLSHAIISRLLQTPYIALPNLLAGEELVPEFVQTAAYPAALAEAVLTQLDNESLRTTLVQRFAEQHEQLRRNAGDAVAAALLDLTNLERG